MVQKKEKSKSDEHRPGGVEMNGTVGPIRPRPLFALSLACSQYLAFSYQCLSGSRSVLLTDPVANFWSRPCVKLKECMVFFWPLSCVVKRNFIGEKGSNDQRHPLLLSPQTCVSQ